MCFLVKDQCVKDHHGSVQKSKIGAVNWQMDIVCLRETNKWLYNSHLCAFTHCKLLNFQPWKANQKSGANSSLYLI